MEEQDSVNWMQLWNQLNDGNTQVMQVIMGALVVFIVFAICKGWVFGGKS